MEGSVLCDDQIDALFETFYQESQRIENEEEREDNGEGEQENEDGETDQFRAAPATDRAPATDLVNAFQNAFEQHLAKNGQDVNREISHDAPSTQCDEALNLNSQTDAEKCLDVFAITKTQSTSMPPPALLDTKGYVRSIKVSSKAPDSGNKKTQLFTTGPMPLMIRDVLRVHIKDGSEMFSEREYFGRRFKIVMFFGRCVQKSTLHEKYHYASSDQQHNMNKRIYEIDDGTAHILVHFKHTSEQYHETQHGIKQLVENYKSCRSGTNPECQQMLEHLRAIITKIKRNAPVYKTDFENGSALCVIGAPFFNVSSNSVQVYATDICEGSKNRELELDFKRTLCDFYVKRYLRTET